MLFSESLGSMEEHDQTLQASRESGLKALLTVSRDLDIGQNLPTGSQLLTVLELLYTPLFVLSSEMS